MKSDIIYAPVITEKSSNIASDGKTYVFKVAKNANKVQIKQAFEEAFGVKVASVNTLNTKPKDKREGKYKYKKENIEVNIVDLPGIYSLSPYTSEEVISRNYILEENPDCIINIIDATNFERNLYLTTQVIEMNVPVIVALNMIDIVEKNGN